MVIEDNTADYTDDDAVTGVYIDGAVHLDWVGVSGSSSVFNNRQGIWLGRDSTVDIQGVDFGKVGSADDNIHADIALNDSRYRAQSNAEFICDGNRCSTDSRVPDGDPQTMNIPVKSSDV